MAEDKETKSVKGEKPSSDEKKKKSTKKDAEIEKLKSELEAKADLLVRTAAEFDNYKKRTEREKTSVAEYAKS